jgi:hypothetical protein
VAHGSRALGSRASFGAVPARACGSSARRAARAGLVVMAAAPTQARRRPALRAAMRAARRYLAQPTHARAPAGGASGAAAKRWRST